MIGFDLHSQYSIYIIDTQLFILYIHAVQSRCQQLRYLKDWSSLKSWKTGNKSINQRRINSLFDDFDVLRGSKITAPQKRLLWLPTPGTWRATFFYDNRGFTDKNWIHKTHGISKQLLDRKIQWHLFFSFLKEIMCNMIELFVLVLLVQCASWNAVTWKKKCVYI